MGPLPVPHLCVCACVCTCLCGVCAHTVLVTFLPAVLGRMEGPVWLVASASSVHHRETVISHRDGREANERGEQSLCWLSRFSHLIPKGPTARWMVPVTSRAGLPLSGSSLADALRSAHLLHSYILSSWQWRLTVAHGGCWINPPVSWTFDWTMYHSAIQSCFKTYPVLHHLHVTSWQIFLYVGLFFTHINIVAINF